MTTLAEAMERLRTPKRSTTIIAEKMDEGNNGFEKQVARAYLQQLADIKVLLAALEWQPIETAPKDGTRFVGYVPPQRHAFLNKMVQPQLFIAYYKEGILITPSRQRGNADRLPTKWFPIAAPSVEGGTL